MSRKRSGKNLKLQDFKGNPNAARNDMGFLQRINPYRTGYEYIAPATKIAKVQSEKYRRIKK